MRERGAGAGEKEESGRQAEGHFFLPKETSRNINSMDKKKEEAKTIIPYLCFCFFSLYTAGFNVFFVHNTLLHQSFVPATKLSM